MSKRQKNTFEKRLREQMKRVKSEEKRAKRTARKTNPPLPSDGSLPGSFDDPIPVDALDPI